MLYYQYTIKASDLITHTKITIAQRQALPPVDLYVEYHPTTSTRPECPTIICLPGGPGGDMGLYKHYQLTQLQAWANIILMDPRGCGNSIANNPNEYHIDVYINDIEAIRQHFELERWVLLGTSYGSMVAQGYAIRYGMDHLQGLILVNGASDNSFFAAARKQVAQRGNAQQIEIFERLISGTINTAQAMTQYYRVMWPLYTLHRADLPARVIDSDLPTQVLTCGFNPKGFLHQINFIPQLHKITRPVLKLVGTEDWITPPQVVIKGWDVVPNCTIHVIEDCSHFMFLDQPQQYFSLIEHWLANLN